MRYLVFLGFFTLSVYANADDAVVSLKCDLKKDSIFIDYSPAHNFVDYRQVSYDREGEVKRENIFLKSKMETPRYVYFGAIAEAAQPKLFLDKTTMTLNLPPGMGDRAFQCDVLSSQS